VTPVVKQADAEEIVHADPVDEEATVKAAAEESVQADAEEASEADAE
jgi:hypothetical protein